MILTLLLFASDPLLKAVPPPPTTMENAMARCGQSDDTGMKAFEEMKNKLDAEIEAKGKKLAEEAQNNQAALSKPVPQDEVKAMTPTMEETKLLQEFGAAASALEASIAGFDEEKQNAIRVTRDKSGCKEGNDGCVKGLEKSVRAAQSAVIAKKGKSASDAWNKLKEIAEKHEKIIGPRLAKVMAGKALTTRLSAGVVQATIPAYALKLSELSSHICKGMQPAE